MRKIETGSFAEACYNQNSIDELKTALSGKPDKTDMKTWKLSEPEWKEQIIIALDVLEDEKEETRKAASILGKKGGSAKSEAKTKAVRENAKKGGWKKGVPRKLKPFADPNEKGELIGNNFRLVLISATEYEVYFTHESKERFIGYFNQYPTLENIIGNTVNDYTDVINRWKANKKIKPEE